MGYIIEGPLTVEDILFNGETVVADIDFGEGFLFKYRVKDIFPTDGLVILYEGEIICEEYFKFAEPEHHYSNNFDEFSRHRTFSMSKSFAGTMIKMLERDDNIEGPFSVNDLVTLHLPHLKDNDAWKDVTVQMVLDMTASIDAKEGGGGCDFENFLQSVADADRDEFGFIDKTQVEPGTCQEALFYASTGSGTQSTNRAPWYNEYRGCKEFGPGRSQVECQTGNPLRFSAVSDYAPIGVRRGIEAMKKDDTRPHGTRFEYLSLLTDVLGWIIEEKTGYNSAEYFSQKIWSAMGAQSDALIAMDDLRVPNWDGSGLTATLRDLARFGQVTLDNGRNAKHEQIIAEEIVLDNKRGGDYRKLEQTTGVPVDIITCLVNPGATTGGKECRKNANAQPPLNSWLKAIDKCPTRDEGNCIEQTGLHANYHNQFWSVVQEISTPSHGQIPGGLIFQEGVRGQSVWTFDEAKLVIARFGSNTDTTESFSLYEYISNLDPGKKSVDFTMWRSFFEIAALFTEKQKST